MVQSTVARVPEPAPADGQRLAEVMRGPRRRPPPWPDERALELCEGMIDIAAALFNVSGKELREPGKSGLQIARVRQIAMYVAHVALRLRMRDIGHGFGRDRTTVVYACHLVEDMRDDEDFDRIVAMTERVALAAFSGRFGL